MSRKNSVWLFCFTILLLATNSISAQNLDIQLLLKINLNRNKGLDPTFRNLSNSVAPVVVVTPISMYGIGMANKNNEAKREAIVAGATILTSVIISNAIKYSVNRTRPFDQYPEVDQAMEVHSPSFPSGHTSQSFALATTLSLSYPKWYVIVPSYLYATTVGFSRMDLGVHYPSDVLVGALVGTGSAFLCYAINQKLK